MKWTKLRTEEGGVEYHSIESDVIIRKVDKNFECSYLGYGKLYGKSVSELKRTVEWVLNQKKLSEKIDFNL